MDFITWWFVKHNIISTIVTPGMSSLYGLYSDSFGRFAIGFTLWSLYKVATKHTHTS